MSSKQLLNCTHEAEWTPFQTRYLSENLVAPGIKPGTSGSVATNSDRYTTEAVTSSIIYDVKYIIINYDLSTI
jgi:hypothetical protein